MLTVVSAFKGYAIEASDGRVGTVSDFLFDDDTWKIRWLVVDTGGWLTERKVLIHPSAVRKIDSETQELFVTLTKAQVKESPDILRDQAVSQQMQSRLYDYYGWDPLWGGGYFGTGAIASPLASPPYFGAAAAIDATQDGFHSDNGDPHLRSVDVVAGYHIHAVDGEIGHLENFLIDDANWNIRYLILDTKNWLPGKHVLVSPYAVKEIDWADRLIYLKITRDQIETSPPRDPTDAVDQDYETRLHNHYRWPVMGSKKTTGDADTIQNT